MEQFVIMVVCRDVPIRAVSDLEVTPASESVNVEEDSWTAQLLDFVCAGAVLAYGFQSVLDHFAGGASSVL